jgi:HTH-type transcriptional regulator / antitoxin HigA
MESPAYKVIKSTEQYKDYCNLLEGLVMAKRKTRAQQDTIELLTLLIEKWDGVHNSFSNADPVELLAYLMKENKLRATALAAELEFSKSLLSDILHYRRGFSREIIRKLSARFKVSQELFNRPYKLTLPEKGRLEKPRVKKLEKKKVAC